MTRPPENLPWLHPGIQRVLPHRFPFLLVDRVIEFVPGQRIVGTKRFSAGDVTNRGGPSGPTFVPISVLLEAVTQLGAILVLERPGMAGKVAVVLQIPSARLLSLVRAGESLQLEAKVVKLGEIFGELRGTASRDGELVAEGVMRFAITKSSDLGLP